MRVRMMGDRWRYAKIIACCESHALPIIYLSTRSGWERHTVSVALSSVINGFQLLVNCKNACSVATSFCCDAGADEGVARHHSIFSNPQAAGFVHVDRLQDGYERSACATTSHWFLAGDPGLSSSCNIMLVHVQENNIKVPWWPKGCMPNIALLQELTTLKLW